MPQWLAQGLVLLLMSVIVQTIFESGLEQGARGRTKASLLEDPIGFSWRTWLVPILFFVLSGYAYAGNPVDSEKPNVQIEGLADYKT